MEKTKKPPKATKKQRERIHQMLLSGGIDRAEAQQIIGRVRQLPANHYLVPVTYADMPSMDDLEKEWGERNVSNIFDGREWELHPSCQDIDRTPGERVFYVHDAGGDWEIEDQIAWGEKQRNAIAPNGYRPAIHEETYRFAKAHPELVDFVGLGSFAMRDGRFVAFVWQLDGQRILGGHWFGSRWNRRIRVLFVSISGEAGPGSAG